MSIKVNLTTNTSSGWAKALDGKIVASAFGDFGSGTLTLERQDRDGNAVPIATGITAQIVQAFDLHKTCMVRGTLAGATSPDIDFEIN